MKKQKNHSHEEKNTQRIWLGREIIKYTAGCDQTHHKKSYLNRLKKQATMIKPVESIFISNGINS